MALGLGVALAAGLAAPAACLFPDYSFDEPEPSGPGGGTTTSQGGGGATGGGGAGPTTSSGGGAPTSSSSSTSTEVCTNGVDDDNNQLVDCEDPGCDAFACVPPVPTGWTGYFALFSGAPGQEPGCPDTYPSTSGEPYKGNGGLIAPPASCACSCGGATGQTCGPLNSIQVTKTDGQCGQQFNCYGEFGVAPAGWSPGACYNDGAFAANTTCGPGTCTTGNQPCNVSVSATAIPATGGACAPALSEQLMPVAWSAFGLACGDAATTGQGCNGGQLCVARPEAPFESGTCIAADGDLSCPAGAFSQKHLFYAGADDTRDCVDDCQCGAPSGGTCPSMVTVYSTGVINTCTGPVATFPAGGCANLTGNPVIGGQTATTPGAPAGATCPASGGTPTGTATPSSPRTFCCTP